MLPFIPIILLILLIITIVTGVYLFIKIKRATKIAIKKSSEITREFAAEQQQKWSQREERNKLPDTLQKAYLQFETIERDLQSLPTEWKSALLPVIDQAHVILLAVSTKPKLSNRIRPFFHHSLDSLSQFINKLKSDHHQLSDVQIDKARQNITVFKADLLQHQHTLNRQKEFDFDVLMDVIKARLKQ